MPEIYSDDNGARVIVRHKGPAGRGFPTGGTTGQVLIKASADDYDASWENSAAPVGAAVGPASAVDDHVAVFDGITGKLIKDGGQPLSNYASVSLVATKQDKETGKGLSTNDYTTVEKDKLATLSPHYRGTYASAALVLSEVATPIAGDYAFVGVVAEDLEVFFWDDTNSEWFSTTQAAMTGQQIADVLFDTEDSPSWSQETCRIFTESEKGQLAALQALVDGALGGIISGTTAYVEKTAAYVIAVTDRTINCTGINSFILTLPTALSNQGRLFVIKNSGTGTITINTSDGIQLIDDNPSYVLATQWESVTVQCTGSGWILI